MIRAADFYCKFSCKTLHTVTSNLYVTTYLNTREEHQNVFMISSMWTNNFARLKDQKSSYLHVKTHSWFLAICNSYFLIPAAGINKKELPKNLWAMKSYTKWKVQKQRSYYIKHGIRLCCPIAIKLYITIYCTT